MYTLGITRLVEILKRRKTQLVFSFFFLVLLLPSYLLGQEQAYSIKQLTLEDGLSQATINDVLLDSSGFSWIATQDGLNRFDGTNFKQFRYDESDSLSVAGQFINTLAEDLDGRIWVGSLGNGLSFYNKKKNNFSRIALQYSQKKNETINDLAVDKSGTIWVATEFSGLHKLSPKKDNTFLQENYYSGQSVSSVYIDNDDEIWIGNQDGEVFQLNSKQSNPTNEAPVFTLKGDIKSFYKQGENLYIGTQLGMYMYTIHTKNIAPITFDENGQHANKIIKCFLPKNTNELWVGTENGLFLLDLSTKKIIEKINDENNELDKKLSNNHIYCLTRLTSNQLLVGTYSSLNIVQFSPPYFKNISKDKHGQHVLTDNVVMSILKENENLWVGSSNYLNLVTKDTTYTFKENQNDPFSLPGKGILSIKKDTINDRIWFASIHGLAMIELKTFNPKKPKFQVFRNNPNDSNSINGNFVKDIAFDANTDLWGVGSGGLFQLHYNNEKDFEFRRFIHDPNDSETLNNNLLNSITIDNEQNIFWLGAFDGIIKVDFENTEYRNPRFTNIIKNDTAANSLSSNSVMKILKDKKQDIWVGTSQGLNLYQGNNTFKSWVHEKQLPSSLIYSIEEDAEGHLWMGTNDGIVKFNPETETFLHYGIKDGIQDKEFDERASYTDSDGTMYFGGIRGVSIFNPEKLKNIDVPKPMYFSELKVKDEVINTYNSSEKWLTAAIENTENLQFSYNDFPFYLNFSSVDYRFHKDVSFAYKLLPTDKEWNVLKDSEIQFLNLPAGDYTLLVNGFSRGIEWEQSPLEMKLSISPPWWATWWIYTFYAFILGVLGYSFYKFQLGKKLALAESTRLRDLDQLKNNLFTNITHEFRTPLTVILGMADSLKTDAEKEQFLQANKPLQMIERNGKKLLQLVNEMLDLAKLESGTMELDMVQADIVPFVKYISESFHSLAEEKDINLTVYAEMNTLVLDFDSNKVESIISNLLSNAIKFTPSRGKIIVHLNKIEIDKVPFFSIKVKDNGLGLSQSEIPHIFNRFYQTDTSTKSKEGTGIGLALTKELVTLMKGTISVESTLGDGSLFTIEIPITNTAIKKEVTKKNIAPVSILNEPSKTQKVSFSEIDSKLPIALIIEDNDDVAHYLKTCLKGKYQTLHAINGAIGLDMAYDRIPDIIISDVMMPEKDGFEVCATLKRDERTDHIPIILLTAKVTVKDRIKGLSLGADAYLAKPFVKEELFTRLDQLLLLRKKMLQKISKNSFGQLIALKEESPETKFLQKVVGVISQEMHKSTFGPVQLAQKLNLSESQVYRKLKAITDTSTAVYIRSFRLHKAKEILGNTDKTVSEVAYDLGFNDPSWFSRAFKEEFGVPPNDINK